MLELIDLSFKINANISKEGLLDVGMRSFDIANEAQAKFLDFQDTSIHVWIEQGSISFKYKILAGIIVIYNAVSGLDGFVGGLEKIVGYSGKAINYITQESVKIKDKNPSDIISYKPTAGFLGDVSSIMKKVRNGQTTPEQATDQVKRLLEKEVEHPDLTNEFINKFYDTSTLIYKTPNEQLDLFPYKKYNTEKLDKSKFNKKPTSPILKPQQEGIEIWQDLKSKETMVRTYVK